MSGQMSLDGFAPKFSQVYNLFLALIPNDGAVARAQALALNLLQSQGLPTAKARTARFHVTLFHVGNFLDEIPDGTLDNARSVAQSMAAAPFEVSLDKVCSFLGKPDRLPVVLLCAPSSTLMHFQSELSQKMMRVALTQGDHQRVFNPHLTLFYGRSRLPELAIEPITWQALDFVLIRSVVGAGVYIEEGRWPLRGPGSSSTLPSDS